MRPASEMTVEQMTNELIQIDKKLNEMFDDPDFEGHGGAPGESLVERARELETALARRVF